MKQTAIIYARQSFGLEEGSASIAVQLDACRAWASKNSVEIIGEFSDSNTSSELYPACQDGIEASKIDRGFQTWKKQQLTKGRKEYKEGLGQAFDKISESKPSYLLVYTRNRLGRTAENSYLDRFFNSYLMEHNTSLVDVQSNTVMDYSDKLMSLLMQLKDSLDYQGLAEKRIASMEAITKRINGYIKWSNAYGVVMKDGIVTFDSKKAEIIRMVYESVLGGTAFSAILRSLNKDYRKYALGKQWWQTNISAMLANPVYCGYMKNRDGVLDKAKNIPSPIVSYAVWSRVQEIVQNKKRNGGKYNFRDAEPKHWLPLSGYIYDYTGRRMVVNFDRGKIIYRTVCPEICLGWEIKDEDLKTIQTLFIINALESRKKLDVLKSHEKAVDELKAAIDRKQSALKAKFRMIETDDDMEMFKDDIDGLKAEIKTLKAELLKAESFDTTEHDRLQKQLDADFHNIMEGKLMKHDDYQRLLQETLSKIIVHEDRFRFELCNGVAFDVPVRFGRWHHRELPKASLLADTESESIGGIFNYRISFDGNSLVAEADKAQIYC